MHSEPDAFWGPSSCFLGSIAFGFKQNLNMYLQCWITTVNSRLPHPDCASQNHFLSPFGSDPLCWLCSSCRTILWLFTQLMGRARSKALLKRNTMLYTQKNSGYHEAQFCITFMPQVSEGEVQKRKSLTKNRRWDSISEPLTHTRHFTKCYNAFIHLIL